MAAWRLQFRILDVILWAIGAHLEAVLEVVGAILLHSLGTWRLMNVKVAGIMGRYLSYRILRGFWQVREAILEA